MTQGAGIKKVWFFVKLKPGKTREDYAKWSLESNHPITVPFKSVQFFRDHKAVSALDGGAPVYDIIEEIVVTDFEAYSKDIGSVLDTFLPEWEKWVESWTAMSSEQIGETGK